MEIDAIGAGLAIGFVVFALIAAVVQYVLTGLLLTKLNKLMYGVNTPLAWIPIANTFLLGKLTVNETFGWIFVGVSFLFGALSFIKAFSFLSTIINLATYGLLIYAFVKYLDLKKKVNSPYYNPQMYNQQSMNNPQMYNQQPMNNQPMGNQQPMNNQPMPNQQPMNNQQMQNQQPNPNDFNQQQ